MQTECSADLFGFARVEGRAVVAAFDGGKITSDAGAALHRIALVHTQFARGTCGTIRLKLLKIGALLRTSVRRIKLAMPSAFAYQAEYHAALTATSH
jgi:hypothetical protein